MLEEFNSVFAAAKVQFDFFTGPQWLVVVKIIRVVWYFDFYLYHSRCLYWRRHFFFGVVC